MNLCSESNDTNKRVLRKRKVLPPMADSSVPLPNKRQKKLPTTKSSSTSSKKLPRKTPKKIDSVSSENSNTNTSKAILKPANALVVLEKPTKKKNSASLPKTPSTLETAIERIEQELEKPIDTKKIVILERETIYPSENVVGICLNKESLNYKRIFRVKRYLNFSEVPQELRGRTAPGTFRWHYSIESPAGWKRFLEEFTKIKAVKDGKGYSLYRENATQLMVQGTFVWDEDKDDKEEDTLESSESGEELATTEEEDESEEENEKCMK